MFCRLWIMSGPLWLASDVPNFGSFGNSMNTGYLGHPNLKGLSMSTD